METLRKVCFILFFVVTTKAYSQASRVSQVDSLAGQFINSLRSDDREKFFLHTDKWFYIVGEEIRFRAYCYNLFSHKISQISKTVFVDLVDERDSVIRQLLLNNSRLKLEGDILLSKRLKEGYYWLRAYTNQILNQDSGNICVQPIYVFNKNNPSLVLQETKSKGDNYNSYDLDLPKVLFYPEGGALISGTNSIVAFRSLNKFSQPLAIEGYVKDGDSIVATFKTGMTGLGKFNFYVWKSRKYTAYVKWKGIDIAFPLPPVNQFASQISLVEQNDNYVRVQISMGDSLYKKNKATYLLGISRDSLCFAATGIDMYDVIVPKSNFPQGKATFLLFNEKQKVVSERNFYVERNNLVVNIRSNKKIYGAREKAKLDIDVANSDNHPLIALLSLSVTIDSLVNASEVASNVNELANDNIEFIKSDDPTSQLQTNTPEQWDLIMLTQTNGYLGWKYDKDTSLMPSKYLENDSAITSINGRILDKTNQPLKNRIVTLISYKNPGIFGADTTDEHGSFHFPLHDYADSIQITLQVTNLKGVQQPDKIMIDTFSFPRFITPVQLKKRFSSTEIQELKHFKTNELDSFRIGNGKGLLKEVIVKGYIKKPVNYDESKRLSPFSRIVTSDQFGKGGIDNINNALLMIPGVGLRQGFLVIRGGAGLKLGPNSEPLLVVNGIEIGPSAGNISEVGGGSPIMSYLNSFEPGIVDFIEVLTGPESAIYGMKGANGVILVNTKARGIKQNESVGLLNYHPKGYSIATAFESPDYSKKEAKNSAYPDQRSTIYWNGTIFTDDNGKASVSFFTADGKTDYTITLEGITATGVIVYKKMKLSRQ